MRRPHGLYGFRCIPVNISPRPGRQLVGVVGRSDVLSVAVQEIWDVATGAYHVEVMEETEGG